MLFIFCVINFFISSVYASEYNVKLINNSKNYSMLIRYKICPVNLKEHRYDCEGALMQEVELDSKAIGQHFTQIPLDDLYWYVKIMDVIERDETGKVKAQGDFRLHICTGYYDRAILFNDYDTPYVICETESLKS